MQADNVSEKSDEWQQADERSSTSSTSAMPVTTAMQDLSIERDWDLLSNGTASTASIGDRSQQHDVEARQQHKLDVSVLEDWRRITGAASPMTATESEAGASELSAVSSNAFDPVFFPERNATPTNKSGPRRECSTRHGVLCQLCSEEIRGMRWMCKECPQWSVCTNCFVVTAEHEVHPVHTFIRIFSPTDIFKVQEQPKLDFPFDRTRMDIIHQPTVHLDVACYNCKGSVIGNRYDCAAVDCAKRDISFCQDCEALPINCHPPEHPLIKYKLPKETSRPFCAHPDDAGVPTTTTSSNTIDEGLKQVAMVFPTARHEELSRPTLPEERDFHEKRSVVQSKRWMMDEPDEPAAVKRVGFFAERVPSAWTDVEGDDDLEHFWD